MKIVLVNRFFYPDTSATSQIASDLAFHLAGLGREVHAITSQNPDQLRAEQARGITIQRVSKQASGDGLFGRAGAYLRFYAAARSAIASLVEPGDIVIAMTDPPLLSAAVGPMARKGGARVVVWLQDVFPEVAHVYGIPGASRGLSGALLHKMRDNSLRKADRLVAIGERMAERIRELPNMNRGHVRVIHNWAVGDEVMPIEPEASELRKEWGLLDRFVVEYSGNLGRVHEFKTLLAAAKLLQADTSVVFLIVGRGPRLAEFQSGVAREGLPNVIFKPHQGRELLFDSLGAGDVHLSVLRPEFEGLIQPSKLYGIMAAGRPTIFIGAPDAETASILRKAEAGVTVNPGDAAGLVGAITELRNDPESRLRMGRNARKAFDEQYDMPLALAHWRRLLAELGG